MKELYITGAGVSSASGIPTFRGSDGFWTVGSVNYTPQEMATRYMYENYPDQFLLWYFKRFIAYKDAKPNFVCNSMLLFGLQEVKLSTSKTYPSIFSNVRKRPTPATIAPAIRGSTDPEYWALNTENKIHPEKIAIEYWIATNPRR